MFIYLLSVFQRYYDNAPDSEKQTLRSMTDLIILLSDQVHRHIGKRKTPLNDSKST